jgi:hypothetical protein
VTVDAEVVAARGVTEPQCGLFAAFAVESPEKIVEIVAADPGGGDAPVA